MQCRLEDQDTSRICRKEAGNGVEGDMNVQAGAVQANIEVQANIGSRYLISYADLLRLLDLVYEVGMEYA